MTGELMMCSREGTGKLIVSSWLNVHKRVNKSSPILPSHATRGSCLCTNLGTESIYFIDDKAFHPFYGIFFLEAEIENLKRS